MTAYETARTRMEVARQQAEESRQDFRAAKDRSGMHAAIHLFTAAMVYAESCNLLVEEEDAFENLVIAENEKAIRDETAARLDVSA